MQVAIIWSVCNDNKIHMWFLWWSLYRQLFQPPTKWDEGVSLLINHFTVCKWSETISRKVEICFSIRSSCSVRQHAVFCKFTGNTVVVYCFKSTILKLLKISYKMVEIKKSLGSSSCYLNFHQPSRSADQTEHTIKQIFFILFFLYLSYR